jgi:hypothetical protein
VRCARREPATIRAAPAIANVHLARIAFLP